MRRYALLALGLILLFLGAFALVESLGVELLTDPGPWMRAGRGTAAAVGLGLLVGDVLLPIPSSAVMTLNGALLGLVPGLLVSWVGGVGATLVAFAIGRRGGPWVSRLVSPAEEERAHRLFDRWGGLALLLSRPVPLLAETVAILAGTTRLSWRQAGIAACLGCLPAAALYALVGQAWRWSEAAAVWGSVIIVAGLTLSSAAFWIVGLRLERRA